MRWKRKNSVLPKTHKGEGIMRCREDSRGGSQAFYEACGEERGEDGHEEGE